MTTGNRLIIITGGGSGLGYELARLHLQKSDQVVIVSRDRAKLTKVQATLNAPPQLHIYPLDVTDNEAVRRFAAWVKIRFGGCDILYNNAGSAVFKPFLDMNLNEIRQTLAVNLEGVLYMTRAFLPMMMERSSGQVVNIASLAGEVATAKAAVYAASKAAVIRFSEGLRQEVTADGITVTCVLPGPIDTPFLDRADRSGAYRDQVGTFLLKPERAARTILRAVEAKRATAAMPLTLSLMSGMYRLLPQGIRALISPYLNRK
ncbi:SDR family NAD(P)-dependent oxidoreductase [Brevibacillus humidisoli]|uniref:SDR family NAD(P)-dependent oxidoreductase n=1 Tax=Brevibacillus humidisoli TaxID=2895522 RepID=UPI001E410AB8|nr:SDR family NAD(P)-dependent oxidoreductase [Brevibacillus humidisoli]UFJ41589.1 SDR family NAD(P)-dependent oxidoreductase [Brevibacillus humidisoli]